MESNFWKMNFWKNRPPFVQLPWCWKWLPETLPGPMAGGGTHGQKKREEWSFLVTDWSGKRSSQRTSRSWLLPLLFHLLHHHLHRYHHHHHHYHHHLHHHQPYHNHHHCHAYLTNWHIDTLLYTSMLPRSPISLGELPPFKSHWGLPYPHYIKLQNPSPLHSQMLFFSTFTEA